MIQVYLTHEEKSDILTALWMRINYIETGNIAISAQDAERYDQNIKIKALSEEQMRGILRMKALQEKILTSH